MTSPIRRQPKKPPRISDTSKGPRSRGVHYLWVAAEEALMLPSRLACRSDFTPHNLLDDQFLMIVDLSDPVHPKETGRWWLPGTRVGDTEPPPPRVHPFDSGIRMHTPTIAADEPNRVYVGWIDGGWLILDTTDKAHPKPIVHMSWQSQNVGFAHTVLAIQSRHLAIQTEEAVGEECKDSTKLDWVWDLSDETAPVVLSAWMPPVSHDFDALQEAFAGAFARAQHSSEPAGCDGRAPDENRGRQFLQRRSARLLDPRIRTRRWEIGLTWWTPRRRATRRTRFR